MTMTSFIELVDHDDGSGPLIDGMGNQVALNNLEWKVTA